MTTLRMVLATASIVGWLLLLVVIVNESENRWGRYVRDHHCTIVDGSPLWSYVPRGCEGCAPIQFDSETFLCDGGEWVQRR